MDIIQLFLNEIDISTKTPSTSHVKYIELIDKLKISKDQYVIIGSGLLAAYGIRPNKDLDIIVTKAYWKKLVNDKRFNPQKASTSGEDSLEYKNGKLEIYQTLFPMKFTTEQIIRDDKLSIMIDGYIFISPWLLKKWKHHLGRDKDLKDIELFGENEMRKDYGMIMAEQCIEEMTPTALAVNTGLGVAAGAASGYLAKQRNIKNLAKLQKARAACGNDPACAQRYDEMIKKYKAKIQDSGSSMVKRSIGGAVTGGWGNVIHHPLDARKKRNEMKRIIKKLQGQLTQCKDDACKKKIQAQIAAMNDEYAHIK